MDQDEIVRLTDEYGTDWGTDHAKRLIHIVSMLGEKLDYNKEAIWIAAYLHDWGGYTKWMLPGVDHWTRSAEVARDFLTERGCPKDLMELVIECIANHHGGDPDRSIESRLFTDADALDLLGVVGTLRVFGMNPRNLKGAITAVKRYRDWCIKSITMPQTRELADKRIQETDDLLKRFEEETFGIY